MKMSMLKRKGKVKEKEGERKEDGEEVDRERGWGKKNTVE